MPQAIELSPQQKLRAERLFRVGLVSIDDIRTALAAGEIEAFLAFFENALGRRECAARATSRPRPALRRLAELAARLSARFGRAGRRAAGEAR